MGTIPLSQPTLPTPHTLQQNPKSNIQPQLLAQPNPNPNNRPIQSVQIIKGLDPKLKLRYGRIITPNEDKNLQPENPHLIKPLTIKN